MHDYVGSTIRDLADLRPEKPHTRTDFITSKGGSHGQLKFKVVYKPFPYYTNFEDVCTVQKAPIGTPQGGGLLVIIIHQGSGLKGKHHTNPYVSFLFRGEPKKTMFIKKTSDPIWEEEFKFMLEQPPLDEEELNLEVISNPWKGLIYRKEESLGYANIRVADVVNKKRINKTYHLHNSKHDALVKVELQWRTTN